MFAFLRVTEHLLKNRHGYLSAINSYSTEALTNKELCAVLKSWNDLKNKKEQIGKDFFTKLFDDYREYACLFSKYGGCPEEILGCEEFIRGHAAGNVMCTLGTFLPVLDEKCKVTEMAVEVGKNHCRYDVTPEHFQLKVVTDMKKEINYYKTIHSCNQKHMRRITSFREKEFDVFSIEDENARPILMCALENNACKMDCKTKAAWNKGLTLIFCGLIKGVEGD